MERYLNDDIYRLIFENCSDAVLIADCNGIIHRANRAACELFQKTEDELYSENLDIVDLKNPEIRNVLNGLSQTDQLKGEYIYLRDGTEFVGDTAAEVVCDQNGNQWIIITIRDITRFIQAEKALQKISNQTSFFSKYDDLTKILNRRSFISKLKQEMTKSKKEQLPLSLILVDIDYFKMVNDRHGHPTGDIVLKCCVLCLIENLRTCDHIGRYGGDEFLICLPNTSNQQAAVICERLRRLIEKMEVEHNSEIIKVTASFGIACFDHTTNEDIESIIARVDEMMYKAKSRRNCVYGI